MTKPNILRALAAALLTLLLTACGGTPMATEGELQAEAERIGESMLAAIDDVERAQDDLVGSERRFVNAELGDRERNAERWRQWTADITLPPDGPVSPTEAATRMAAVLEADDWVASEPEVSDIGTGVDYRKAGEPSGSWYVGLSYTTADPPRAQTISITIVSPYTTKD